MRMWNVPPEVLCRKHLLGEHVEMHMFIGTIQKGVSIKGYLEKGLVDPSNIYDRHELLANEINNRGMNHKSSIVYLPGLIPHFVNSRANIKELQRRCPDCNKRIKEYMQK